MLFDGFCARAVRGCYNWFATKYPKVGFLRFLCRLSSYVMVKVLSLTPRNPMCEGDLSNPNTLVVSLTSYGDRLKTLHFVAEVLMRQNLNVPYRVVVWVSADDVPSVESLPATLRKLMQEGLDVRIVSGDLKSHKKYIYTLEQYPANRFLTVDDDIMYGTSVLSKLVAASDANPGAICFMRGRRIPSAQNGVRPTYVKWDIIRWHADMGVARDVLPTGVGGVIYPSGCFHPSVRDVDAIKSTCLMGDDLWLNFMYRLNGHYPFFVQNEEAFHGLFAVKTKLHKLNVGQNRNDTQIDAISKWGLEKLGKDFFFDFQ